MTTPSRELPEGKNTSAPARSLTPEQIASALAKAQGIDIAKYWNGYRPLVDNDQLNELTLDPEIHAGMIDVLDEWFSEYSDEVNPELVIPWNHAKKYLQDIRLWQLRACVEFLRNRRKK